jgi:DEAD/DEAH box helicase domain-containing protein
VLEQALEALAPGLKQLAQSGASPPEVGLELVDTKGRVAADCELAWVQEKLASCGPTRRISSSWGCRGWKVVLLDEAMNLVAGYRGLWPLLRASDWNSME